MKTVVVALCSWCALEGALFSESVAGWSIGWRVGVLAGGICRAVLAVQCSGFGDLPSDGEVDVCVGEVVSCIDKWFACGGC